MLVCCLAIYRCFRQDLLTLNTYPQSAMEWKLAKLQQMRHTNVLRLLNYSLNDYAIMRLNTVTPCQVSMISDGGSM